MVKVPLKAQSGTVKVINGQKEVEVGTFTLQNVRITRLDPPEAEAGSVLVIHGEHFGNTAGSRDPNTMFGVNQVTINGIRAEVRKMAPQENRGHYPSQPQSRGRSRFGWHLLTRFQTALAANPSTMP